MLKGSTCSNISDVIFKILAKRLTHPYAYKGSFKLKSFGTTDKHVGTFNFTLKYCMLFSLFALYKCFKFPLTNSMKQGP